MSITGNSWRLTFTVLIAAVTAFSMLQSLLVPVLAEIGRQYDADTRTVAWVLTSYLLSASILTPLFGRIGDMVGKRLMLTVSLGLLTLGSLLAAIAPTLGVLVAARVLQGAGGGVLPLSFGIIRDELGEKRVSGAVSLLAAAGALGYGAGIIAAGPIVAHLGYAWLFWLPMIVTALATVATILVIPDSPTTREGGRLPWGPPCSWAPGWSVCCSR